MGRKRPLVRAAEVSFTKEEEHTIKSFVRQQVDKFFVEHLPMSSLRELPPGHMYYFGTVAYICMITAFIYFVYTSYVSTVNQAFIALDPSSGNCQNVPIAVSGTYLADGNGNWEGSPQFAYSQAIYSLTLQNFQVKSFTQYQDMMGSFRQSLISTGQFAENRSLSYNLVLWSSYLKYYSVDFPDSSNYTSIGLGQVQYMQMTGSPAIIFGTAQHQTVFSSGAGICPILGFTSYDTANALLSTQLNATKYEETSICMSCVYPSLMGYSSSISNDVFSVGIDVRSFTTAIAVNFGILKLDDLGTAGDTVTYVNFDNATYQIREYFDLRYELMDPILCVRNVTAVPHGTAQALLQQLCFYLEGEIIAFPVFSHFGGSYSAPEYCLCDDGVGERAECQTFNLLTTLLFYPVTNKATLLNFESVIETQLLNQLRLVSKYNDYLSFNNAAYNGSWSAAAQAYGHKSHLYTSSYWQQSAFKFCQLTKTTTCSMLTFNSYSPFNTIVSPYKYDLVNGSCRNSLAISAAAWENLASSAPVQLTQTYYECYPTASSAFFNALGIASGNTQLMVPLVVLATIPLLYGLLLLFGLMPPKEEYKTVDKEQVLETLSIILLRLRDGKSRGFPSKGVLQRLTKELVAAAREEAGYPDSDDEEDEDDEDESSKKRKSRKRNDKANKKQTAVDSDDEVVDEEDEGDSKTEEKDEEPDSDDDEEVQRSKKRKTVLRRVSSTPAGVKKNTKLAVFTRHLEAPVSSQSPKRGSAVTSFLHSHTRHGQHAETELTEVDIFALRRWSDLGSKDYMILNVSRRTKKPNRRRCKTYEHLAAFVDDILRAATEACAASSSAVDTLSPLQRRAYTLLEVENDLVKSFIAPPGADDEVRGVTALKLSHALRLHARVELGKEVDTDLRKVGYAVGSYFVSLQVLSDLTQALGLA